MVEEYLLLNASGTVVLESWGLDSTTKLADWKDLQCGFDIELMRTSSCRYRFSHQAFFRVCTPAYSLGLGTGVVWPILQFVDDAVTPRKLRSPWNYIEWYILQGMWHQVAAKLLRDKIICEQAMFTREKVGVGFERSWRLSIAVSEAFNAVKRRYFSQLELNGYTLSKYALDLCNDDIHHDPTLPLTTQQILDSQRRKRKTLERHSIMRGSLERAGLKDDEENQDGFLACNVKFFDEGERGLQRHKYLIALDKTRCQT